MYKRGRLVALLLAVPVLSASGQGPTGAPASGPTIDDLISLKRAGAPAISADGKWVACTVRETSRRIATIPTSGGRIENVSADFDEDPSIVRWTSSGIFFSASSHTWSYLFSLDPATKKVTKDAPAEKWIGSNFSLSANAQTVAFIASDAATFPEVYVAPVKTMQPKKLSDLGGQAASWMKAPIEVIPWPSRDGATIEGVLHKPVGFEQGKGYPLLVVVHGGPTGVSRPSRWAQASPIG